jgi:hypothetical protein
VSDRGQFGAASEAEDRHHDHVRAVGDGGELRVAALAGSSVKGRPSGEVGRLSCRARPLQGVPVETDPCHRWRTGQARAVLARAQFPVKSFCSVQGPMRDGTPRETDVPEAEAESLASRVTG